MFHCLDYNGYNEDKVVGKGIYLESSFFGHSCRPNSLRRSEGINAKLIALETIDTEREKVTISYVPLMETRAVRKLNLLENYFFDCHCVRCLELESDDELCDKFYYLNEKLRESITEEDFEEAFYVALEGSEICEKVLGSFSILGTIMNIAVLDNLIECFINSDIQKLGRKDFKRRVKKVRECIRVTHGFHIESFRDDISKFERCLEMLN